MTLTKDDLLLYARHGTFPAGANVTDDSDINAAAETAGSFVEITVVDALPDSNGETAAGGKGGGT